MPPLSALLAEAVGTTGAPAIGAALVGADGAHEVEVAGTRVRARDLPVAAGDPWHIGSCAKAMTALVYARLVESGRASWGAALPDLLPDLAAAADPGWAAVTIDDVLRHRAGLRPNLSWAAMRRGADDPRPLREARTAVAAEALARAPRRPGGFRYSNVGYMVAGAVIERIADRAWEEALAAEVLDPLGITSAGFGAPGGDAPWGHRPWMAGRGRGPAMDPARPGADNPPVMGPAGTVHLSLADWARFVAQFLEGGATLVGGASIDQMLAAPEGRGPPHGMGWVHVDERARRLLGTDVVLGQQGSNRRWAATAVVAGDRRRAALVVANDGRSRLLLATARLAGRVLREP